MKLHLGLPHLWFLLGSPRADPLGLLPLLKVLWHLKNNAAFTQPASGKSLGRSGCSQGSFCSEQHPSPSLEPAIVEGDKRAGRSKAGPWGHSELPPQQAHISHVAALHEITASTSSRAGLENCSISPSFLILDTFCKPMPLPKATKRQLLGIKAARETVQLIKTTGKSLDYFQTRFLPVKQHRNALT